jgi:hypothetical protein
VDCAIQTDPAEFPSWDEPGSQPTRATKPYTSLKKRLLLRCQRDRRRLEAQQRDDVDIPKEAPNINQQAIPSDLIASTVCLATDGDALEDSKVEDIVNISVLPPEQLSVDVPLQKPRPPGEAPNGTDQVHMAEIKPPPPPLLLLETQLPPVSPLSNGICSVDLRAQPMRAPSLPDETATKSDAASTRGPVPARLPAVQTSSNNQASLPVNLANLAQPSPVRKKLSVAEYFKLVNTNKTETLSAPDHHAVNSPVLQPSPLKTTLKPDLHATKAAAASIPGSKKEDDDLLKAGKDSKP